MKRLESKLPNILLCTIDALRFDAVPRITALENDKWCFFKNHYSVAHCSDPNYAAILCGYSPDWWKVEYDDDLYTQMGSDYKRVLPTLPLMLKHFFKDRYKCWAFEPVGVPGFYYYGFDEVVWFASNDVSEPTTPAIKQILSGWGKDQPWFGFVRTMDCHYPYLGGKEVPNDQPTKVFTDYWKAIEHTNEFLMVFLNWILDKYPNTLIFVLSDHGESLGEHDLWDHLFTLYEVLVHIPLWVHYPGNKVRKVCSGLTQHTDIVPTICDFLELDIEGEGQSWVPWLAGRSAEPDRDLVSLVAWGCHPLGKPEEIEGKTGREMWKHRAIRAKPWKYIVNWHETKGIGVELFHLNRDPEEERNVSSTYLHIAKKYSDILYKIAPHFPRFRTEIITPAYTQLEAEQILERLVALGYA